MSWRAIFLDGPLEGQEHDRAMFGKWQDRLVFAREPTDTPIHTHDGYMLVGAGEHSPLEGSPAVELFVYVRDDERSQLLEAAPGEDEGWGAYRLEVT